MTPYIVVFILIFITGYLAPRTTVGNRILTEEEKIKNFLIVSFLILIVLTSLRSVNVGADTNNYINYFRRVYDGVYYVLDEQFEYGFRLFTYLVSRITDNVNVYFAIIALVCNIPIARFIYKYSCDCFLSTILYITVGSFTFQLTGIRQSIALAILVIAVDYAIDRKALKFFILIVVAALFHKSALLFFPVYFLADRKTSTKRYIFISIAAAMIIVAGSLFNSIANKLGYQEYVGNEGVNTGNGWTYIVIISIALILFIITRYNLNKNMYVTNIGKEESLSNLDEQRIAHVFFNILLFGLAFYLMRYQFRVAERISLYYRTALLIVLPNAINAIENRTLRMLIRYICIILAIALFFYWLSDPNTTYLYSTFWRK